MKHNINKNISFIILIFVVLSLISAYFIEYKLGHKPCKLCIYQRIPYFFSIIFLINIIFINLYEKNTLLVLSFLFVVNSMLAFYHVGIEQGFFSESLVCSTKDFAETLSKDELLKQLKQNNISCKNVDFKIFGFSIATINLIFSIVLSAIFTRLFINYGKNQ